MEGTIDETCKTGWRGQFGHPEGWKGYMARHLMAVKNRQRSLWVLSKVDPRPGERILEIGFGPGADLHRVDRHAADAMIFGIDTSGVMWRMARRRNGRAIAEGRMELQCSDAERMPYPDGTFDKVYSINSAQFWDLSLALAEVRRVLRSGGKAIIAVQPKSKGANEGTSRSFAELLSGAMTAAGFGGLDVEMKEMGGAPVVCVAAMAP